MDCKMELALRRIIIVLALLGLLLSLYLLKEHLAPSGKSFCDLSATVSCDIVNKSPYAELFGIPISLLGLLYYLGLLAAVLYPGRLARLFADEDRRLFWTLVTGYLIFGFIFSLYLSSIEAFVLHVWCPLCVTSALIVTTSMLIALFLARCEPAA